MALPPSLQGGRRLAPGALPAASLPQPEPRRGQARVLAAGRPFPVQPPLRARVWTSAAGERPRGMRLWRPQTSFQG